MKRPTWATVVGVMGIVFGCFGVLGSGQLMIMPKMMEIQKAMWSEMQETIERQGTAASSPVPPKAMLEMMEGMWNVPEWFGTYCAVAGIAGLLISGFYVFASIRLLQTRPTAPRLFCLAMGLDIAYALAKVVVAVTTMSFVGMAMTMGGMFGGVVSVVMLIVAATSEKEAFAAGEA